MAEISGRHKSNLSRTLKTMARYGLVELKEGEGGTLVPRVPFDQVRLDVSLTQAAEARLQRLQFKSPATGTTLDVLRNLRS